MLLLRQVGFVPRNKRCLQIPGAGNGCFPWHPLASVGARAHPRPLWAPSPPPKSKLRELIRPRSPPLVIGEEKEMFAYVLHDLSLPQKMLLKSPKDIIYFKLKAKQSKHYLTVSIFPVSPKTCRGTRELQQAFYLSLF